MNLSDLIGREPMTPWAEGGKIPWHEPGFSARMLREHLSQHHDRASRRLERIDRHVAFLHREVCGASPSRVLELGCGPGLYTSRLARRGHTCLGIDFSPASIAHARSEAERGSLSCEYRLEDLREAHFETDFDLVLFGFGELNAFPPDAARRILERARAALSEDGALVLEVHTEAAVRRKGDAPSFWYTAHQGLFSDAPHLCLCESAWHGAARAATERYWVVEARSGEARTYVSTTQAYREDEYHDLLAGLGLQRIERHASLSGADTEDPGLFVLVACAGRAAAAVSSPEEIA